MISLTYPTPSIIMVGGVPGSGKSTFIEKVADENVEIISADDVRGWVQIQHGFRYEDFRKELIPEARRMFFRDLEMALEDEKNILLDAAYLTMHARKEIWAFLHQKRAWDYQHHLIMLSSTKEEAWEGMQGRERIVPAIDFERYWRQYTDFIHDWERSALEVELDTVLRLSRKDCDSVSAIRFA